ALPLHQRGIEMVGVDLSVAMLAKLREKAGGRFPFPIAVADAEALPFADSSFGAALAAHVLHVIGGWRAALLELARVVRPGGRVLVDVGGWGTGWWRDVQNRFAREAGIPPARRRTIDRRAVEQAMTAMGATPRKLRRIREVNA